MISFWSPVTGKGNVTVATSLVSLYYTANHDKSKCLLTTSCTNETLTNYFGDSLSERLSSPIKEVTGLLVSGKLDSNSLPRCTRDIEGTPLDLLDWERKTILGDIEKRIYVYLSSFSNYSQTFVDMGGGKLSSMGEKFIEKSSHVVLCISQENTNLIEILSGIKYLKDEGKSFSILVGSFDYASKITKKHLSVELGVKSDIIHAVPYQTEIRNLCYESNLASSLAINPPDLKKGLFKRLAHQGLSDELEGLVKKIVGSVKS